MMSTSILSQYNFGFAVSQTLATAVELDIFSHIKLGKQSVRQIASAAKASERGTRMLLDALVGMELLRKRNSRYTLTRLSERFLCRDSDLYLGDFFGHIEMLRQQWAHLTDAVRLGKPAPREGKRISFVAELVRGLFGLNFDAARLCARKLEVKRWGKIDVLDIGAGSGVWSIGAAIANRKAQIYAVDFPEVLEITKQFAEKYDAADRFHPMPGNLREVRFEKRSYDLIYLGHICHSEGRAGTRKLINRCGKSLRKGGTIVIAEFVPNEQRTAPLMPLIFALNMLINVPEGDVFTFAEYKEWLQKAGMGQVRKLDVDEHSPLILAKK